MDTRWPVTGRTRRAVTGSVLLLGVLALAGCSGIGGGGDTAAAPAAAVDAGADRSAAGGSAADGKAGPPGSVSTVVPAGLDSPAVVVVGSVTVRATDVPGATRAVTRLAATYGGRVDDQSATAPDTPGGDGGSSVTTVRVPPDRVGAFVDDLSEVGTVAGSDITRSDASAEVADVASRVANARASVVRVRALLDRATKLGDIVMLESEMSKRQSDLEALEARQRVLADQTSLATLTVAIVAQDAVVTSDEPETGFLAGLRSGWAAFTAAAVATMTVLGALTPFLLLALLLGAAALPLIRHRRTRSQPQPEPLDA
jgi:hypothetical protein